MKKFQNFLFIFLGVFWGVSAFAQGLSPRLEMTVTDGATLQIEWRAVGFTPSAKTPVQLAIINAKTHVRLHTARFVNAPEGKKNIYFWKKPAGFLKSDKLEVVLQAYVNRRWVKGQTVKAITDVNVVTVPMPPRDGMGGSPPGPVLSGVEGTGGAGGGTSPRIPIAPPVILTTGMVPGGSTRQFVSQYEFRAAYEPWVVRKLTVVNDNQHDGFDVDANEAPVVITKIYLVYPNSQGVLEEKTASMSDNKATLSGLDFYIPKNGTAMVSIGADVADPASVGPSFSGHTFRLGIQEVGNNAESFEAVGVLSSITDNSMGGFLNTESKNIPEFIVRQAAPVFRLQAAPTRVLTNGDNDVFQFSVTAQGKGAVALSRLVFDVSASNIQKIDQVKFWRGDQPLAPGDGAGTGQVVLMWDAGAGSCYAQTPQTGAGTGMNCAGGVAQSAKLIVTFPQEEVISAGTSLIYKISLNVNEGSLDGNLNVRLATGDESAPPGLGGNVPSTGKIFNGGAGDELFTHASDFAAEASALPARNIIWSDRSADDHRYPVMTSGTPPLIDDSGSADFTNGYLLKVTDVGSVISK